MSHEKYVFWLWRETSRHIPLFCRVSHMYTSEEINKLDIQDQNSSNRTSTVQMKSVVLKTQMLTSAYSKIRRNRIGWNVTKLARDICDKINDCNVPSACLSVQKLTSINNIKYLTLTIPTTTQHHTRAKH